MLLIGGRSLLSQAQLRLGGSLALPCCTAALRTSAAFLAPPFPTSRSAQSLPDTEGGCVCALTDVAPRAHVIHRPDSCQGRRDRGGSRTTISLGRPGGRPAPRIALAAPPALAVATAAKLARARANRRRHHEQHHPAPNRQQTDREPHHHRPPADSTPQHAAAPSPQRDATATGETAPAVGDFSNPPQRHRTSGPRPANASRSRSASPSKPGR